MKNTILWGALIALIGTQAYADEPSAAAQATPAAPVEQPAVAPQAPAVAPQVPDAAPQTPAAAPQAPAAAPQAPAAAPQAPAAAPQTPAAAPQTPAAAPQTPATAPQTPAAAPQTPAAAPQTPAASSTPAVVVNCEYKIPPETKKIDSSIVLTWAERAVVQAFSFDPNALDTQMQKLQACFTEQGWSGFNAALQKSGNIEAIKAQKLMVHSQIEGQTTITETKENQWKLILPIAVTYQNEKEKVSQSLSVDLTVSRKPNGDLGIIQMIAAPRGSATLKQDPAATPTPSGAAAPAGQPQ